MCKPRLSATKKLWNFSLLSPILSWVHSALKKFTQAISYIVWTQERRHVHKQTTKRRYGEENPGLFFSENQFCSLSEWDWLRLTPWVSWSEKFTIHWSLYLLSFGGYLSPNSSHKICNKFLIHQRQQWKEGSFVCESVWFFYYVNTYPFDLKFAAFCPKFSQDS